MPDIPQQIAFLVWQKKYNRSVDQQTTDEIYEASDAYYRRQKSFGAPDYMMEDDLADAAAMISETMPPTHEDIAVLALSYYMENQDDGSPEAALIRWKWADQVLEQKYLQRRSG